MRKPAGDVSRIKLRCASKLLHCHRRADHRVNRFPSPRVQRSRVAQINAVGPQSPTKTARRNSSFGRVRLRAGKRAQPDARAASPRSSSSFYWQEGIASRFPCQRDRFDQAAVGDRSRRRTTRRCARLPRSPVDDRAAAFARPLAQDARSTGGLRRSSSPDSRATDAISSRSSAQSFV